MSPRRISDDLVRRTPHLRDTDTVEAAVEAILESGLPALPAVDAEGRLRGIFGEREFMTALFPGYVGELGYAGFVRSTLDDAIEKRATCATEAVAGYLNTEHVDVGPDFSDVGVAEIFLHHRVLIIPVVDGERLAGIITRGDFFRRLAERFLAAS